MKYEQIFIVIILSFSILKNTDESKDNQIRYLDATSPEKQLYLVGFERFKITNGGGQGDYDNLIIDPVFKKYGNISESELNNFELTINYTIKSQNGASPDGSFAKLNLTCDNPKLYLEEEFFVMDCKTGEIPTIKDNKIFSGEIIYFPEHISEIPVEISPRAENLMKNMDNFNITDLTVFKFILMDIIIRDNKVIILEGNITSYTNKTLNETKVDLTLNETKYDCNIEKIKNENYTHKISFSPISSINESLVYKIMDLDGKKRIIHFEIPEKKYEKIEFISDYDRNKGNHTPSINHFIDLLGIQDYQRKNGTGKAYFRGDIDGLFDLKKYLRVKVLVRPILGRLRSLDVEYINITGIGEKDENLENIQKGQITYNITYDIQQNQEPVRFWDDFEFSDNEAFPPNETIKANQMNISTDLADPYSINKSYPLVIKFMNIINIDKNQSGSHLTFEFDPGNELGTITKTNGTVNYIPIINNSNSEREEMNCTYERNNTIHKLICEPGKNIKTYTNTWRINIWKTKNNNSLRNLQEVGNTTFFLDKSGSNDNLIEYTYVPEKTITPPVRKKKKGLSAGAIVAIVLATVAVVAAVIVALLLLKTGPKAPMEADKISIPNSSTNINH